ncbi:MAG: hypothetical protein RL768_1643, partial [Nitrospirota bacterium]
MKRPSANRRPAISRQIKQCSSYSYEGLLDGLPMGVILVNVAHGIHAMNAEAGRLCGGSASGQVGRPFPELWQKL